MTDGSDNNLDNIVLIFAVIGGDKEFADDFVNISENGDTRSLHQMQIMTPNRFGRVVSHPYHQALCFVKMMGDLRKWENTILGVPISNPQLEQLSLSICNQSRFWRDEAANMAERYDSKLFKRICDSYAQKQKTH